MEQPEELEIRFSYDMEAFTSLRDHQREQLARIMAIPSRLLYNPLLPGAVELSFNTDACAVSVSEALARWFDNIKYSRNQSLLEAQWTYVRYTKWLKR